MEFKKASLKEVIFYKIKWLFETINRSFKILESWM